MERSRWRRQQGIRWDERRLDAYVKYAASVKRNSTAVARVLAGRGIVKSIKAAEEESGLIELAEAEAERSTLFEAVLMLGDGPTIDAASALNRQVWRMQALARGELPVDVHIWRETFHDYRKARLAFYRDGRSSMGVPAATMPQSSAWSDSVVEESKKHPILPPTS